MRNSQFKLAQKRSTRRAPVLRLVSPPAEKPAVESGFIDPLQLHDLLERAATKIITFASEKKLNSYRAMLYKVNGQGEFRYRTLRDEQSMWGLVIWRMK